MHSKTRLRLFNDSFKISTVCTNNLHRILCLGQACNLGAPNTLRTTNGEQKIVSRDYSNEWESTIKDGNEKLLG